MVLHFSEDKMMHVAWAGDSQALLVKNGEAVQIVTSHKANRQVGKVIYSGEDRFYIPHLFSCRVNVIVLQVPVERFSRCTGSTG